MKNFLHASLIAIVLSSLFASSLVSADATTVFFMKADSSAKINIEYTFSDVGNWTLYPSIYPMPNSGGTTSSVIAMAIPSFFNVTTPQNKYDVTYVVTPKNNVTGAFEIYTGFCGRYYPIVVGLNQTEVNPKIFENFNNGVNFGCSPYQPDINTEHVVSYLGITPVSLSENSSTWSMSMQSSTTPEFPFAISMLIISITSLIIFYRIMIRN